ncbi:MAG: ATP-grasp domain-containing protein [Candidatus Bathyarchaeia archaeon]|nr:ATP-grasp domain-containing protein [Candidatus Bathyarchaeota archaeon]
MALRVGILFNLPMKPLKGEEIDYLAEEEILDQVNAVQEALERLGIHYCLLPVGDDIEEVIRALKTSELDAVINLCEGFMGDSSLEMCIPSILELLRIPYTGSTPLTLGLCQDKGLAKAVLKAYGVPTPDYCIMMKHDKPHVSLSFPLIVKPLREDASIGITRRSFVKNLMELKSQVEYINDTYRQPALVEEYISGREFNVSILGNESPIVLPISEIIFDFEDEPKIVDYKAKWFKESEEYIKTRPVCPAELDEDVRSKVEDAALRAYRVLGCRDYARVDIRFEDKTGKPYVLEVNPNPDVSPEAGFTRSLKVAGISFEDFIKKILEFALERADRGS